MAGFFWGGKGLSDVRKHDSNSVTSHVFAYPCMNLLLTWHQRGCWTEREALVDFCFVGSLRHILFRAGILNQAVIKNEWASPLLPVRQRRCTCLSTIWHSKSISQQRVERCLETGWLRNDVINRRMFTFLWQLAVDDTRKINSALYQ